MNQKATYELTITEKLEQLKAPDMVDAIWARIEAQLDIDLPTDDGPTNPPAAPKSGPRKWINRGFIIAAVAIVLIYLFNNRKQTITTNDQPTISTPNTPVPNENPIRNNSPGTNNNIQLPSITTAPTTSPAVVPVDSNAAAPVMRPVLLQPDTAVKTNAAPVFNPPVVMPPKNTPADSTKKNRGVKGITDADYKIVPKKDSSKN